MLIAFFRVSPLRYRHRHVSHLTGIIFVIAITISTGATSIAPVLVTAPYSGAVDLVIARSAFWSGTGVMSQSLSSRSGNRRCDIRDVGCRQDQTATRIRVVRDPVTIIGSVVVAAEARRVILLVSQLVVSVELLAAAATQVFFAASLTASRGIAPAFRAS